MSRPAYQRREKTVARIPAFVSYRPAAREFRAVFSDYVLFLRAAPRLQACGIYYHGGSCVFDASDAPLWNFNAEQQRFVDAIRIASAVNKYPMHYAAEPAQ